MLAFHFYLYICFLQRASPLSEMCKASVDAGEQDGTKNASHLAPKLQERWSGANISWHSTS